ncbi:MAG TPA: calcineurin-like phosphoesterase family protein [Gemmatimonadales bacterium]|nr:calcineurin-like phosphoesterase family protein [Gemmatimonadales bacterium]
MNLRGDLSRREFLAGAASIGAALVLPAPLRGNPYGPFPLGARPASPVRVRGRVTALGRPVRGAAVSDGLSVVATDADGRYQLIGDAGQPHVFVSPPAGFAVPVGPTGTARLYQPLAPDPRGEATALFALTPLDRSDERHGFVVLADPQTQDDYEMTRFQKETVPDVQATVKALGDLPLFGVTDGDIMYDNLGLFDAYEAQVTRMGLPFFQVVGNHDLDLEATTDEASTATFTRRFGPRYYSFNRGRLHYVVLDDVFYYRGGYLGYLPADQLTWLAADLALVPKGSTVVVFLHIPLESSLYARHGAARPEIANSVTNREALLALLQPYQAHLISGHTHECEHRSHGRALEHTLGAACGAWWTGDICYDGTPNGYGVFEVAGDELRWRYQATGRPADHQCTVYPAGADPRAPDEIVANAWNWDPSWTVTWYEGGERKGAMARRLGLDPVAVRTQSGPDLPKRRGWVDPEPTAHLFYAPAGRGKEVRVEVTDRFGRVSSLPVV